LARDALVGVTVIEVRTSVGGGVLTALDEPPHPLAAKHAASTQVIASTDRTRVGMQINRLLLRESSPGLEMKTSHVILALNRNRLWQLKWQSRVQSRAGGKTSIRGRFLRF
jgi:hypothetical protein